MKIDKTWLNTKTGYIFEPPQADMPESFKPAFGKNCDEFWMPFTDYHELKNEIEKVKIKLEQELRETK